MPLIQQAPLACFDAETHTCTVQACAERHSHAKEREPRDSTLLHHSTGAKSLLQLAMQCCDL